MKWNEWAGTRQRVLLPALVAGLFAAAPAGAQPLTERTDGGPGPSVDGRRVVEIEISRFSFGRRELTIPVGTTVRWVNKDPVGHTSTSDRGDWGSPLIGPGETYEFTFESPGRFSYHCNPHPFMKAVIVVREDG
ncbi:MAG: cupredoxin family copper-binding protein [Gemmatimonadota bacterium]